MKLRSISCCNHNFLSAILFEKYDFENILSANAKIVSAITV